MNWDETSGENRSWLVIGHGAGLQSPSAVEYATCAADRQQNITGARHARQHTAGAILAGVGSMGERRRILFFRDIGAQPIQTTQGIWVYTLAPGCFGTTTIMRCGISV